MSLYNQFGTDKNLEKEGIYLDYGKNSKGENIRIKIARAGGSNMKYQKALERKTKPYRRQIQNETMDEEKGVELNREVYAESVVLGWEGVEDRNGNPLPFTRENCIQLLADLPDLFTDIREQAAKAALFRQEILEADSKNS